jgi:branched-subunit amino acid aminotransferase/4-amino-4-deoxychorismate lyase
MSAAARRVFWIDGRLAGGDPPSISLLDRGARDGEGLFETIRVEGRRPLDLERHLERLVISAAELGFPVPPAPETLSRALIDVIEAAGFDDAAARITITRGVPGGHPPRCGVWIEAEPLAGRLWRGTRAGGAAAIVASSRHRPGPLAGHKTTSRLAYHLARDEARAARADDALLVDPHGQVLEGSVSNVFVVTVAGVVVTPPSEGGILPGLARARVIRLCEALGTPVEERPLTLEELLDAEEAFLTNVIQQVVPLVRVGERELSRRERSLALLEAYRVDVAR